MRTLLALLMVSVIGCSAPKKIEKAEAQTELYKSSLQDVQRWAIDLANGQMSIEDFQWLLYTQRQQLTNK